jgi:hypothetical protein
MTSSERLTQARHFHAKGVPHIDQMMDMWLHGHEWNEIADHVGKRAQGRNARLLAVVQEGAAEIGSAVIEVAHDSRETPLS